MATSVIEAKNASSLKIKFDCGMDLETGKQVTKLRTYSNVKPTASALDVYNVADALVSLQKHDLLEVIKQDSTTINE